MAPLHTAEVNRVNCFPLRVGGSELLSQKGNWSWKLHLIKTKTAHKSVVALWKVKITIMQMCQTMLTQTQESYICGLHLQLQRHGKMMHYYIIWRKWLRTAVYEKHVWSGRHVGVSKGVLKSVQMGEINFVTGFLLEMADEQFFNLCDR